MRPSVTLLHSVPSALLALDQEGRVTALNLPAERLLGVTEDEALGRGYPDVLGASLANRLLALFRLVVREGDAAEPQQIEAALPDGRRATLLANLGPVREAGGAIRGFLVALEDRSLEAEERAERDREVANAERWHRALVRYLGQVVSSELDARPSFIGLGGTRQSITVLHADVRGYTTYAEAHPPEMVMERLLAYHGVAVTALESSDATVDRYVGDAVLAIWNAPHPQPRHAALALKGALSLIQEAQAVGDELSYGVGVHTGDAVVGNLGTDRFMHYTAIGDTVNVAARLQAEAPAGAVVCSDAVIREVGDAVEATSLGALVLKGRSQPVAAYRVLGVLV